MSEDRRRPSDFATQALAEWNSQTNHDSVCMRVRSEKFLDYPQADPKAFHELSEKCDEYWKHRGT